MLKGFSNEVEVLGPEDPASQGELNELWREMRRLEIFVSQMVIALQQKKRARRVGKTIPQRDPLTYDMFRKMIDLGPIHQGLRSSRTHAQVRITLALLYYTGARVNELRRVTRQQIEGIVQNGSISLVLPKTNSTRTCVIPPIGQEQFRALEKDLRFWFETCGYTYLGQTFKEKRKPDGGTQAPESGESQIYDEKSWIRLINKGIKQAAARLNLIGVLNSHSLRINYITRLRTRMDAHAAAQVIGHKSTVTTERYNRYQPNREEIERHLQLALGPGTDHELEEVLDNDFGSEDDLEGFWVEKWP